MYTLYIYIYVHIYMHIYINATFITYYVIICNYVYLNSQQYMATHRYCGAATPFHPMVNHF